MKKASKIILIVSGIIAILAAVTYLVVGIACFSLGQNLTDAIIKAVEGSPEYSGMPYEDLVNLVNSAKVVAGAVFILAGVFACINAVICFMANKKETKGLYIATIVFGVISSTLVSLVGGILGLIANTNENKQAA